MKPAWRHAGRLALAGGLALLALPVWADTQASPHRGGTLRLTAASSAGTLDPQINYTSQYMQVESVVYDGLLTYPKLEGPAGAQVVPDLAQAQPERLDGGRTWVFTLREGIRFSNGAPVTVADVAASLRRIFMVGSPTAGSFYGDIIGADACLRTPAACTLRGGVETDEATRRITIRLNAPDSEFPYKLAFGHAVILPANTPTHDLGNDIAPGTGPYQIVSSDPEQGMRLTRNPYFHEWSEAAQPDGYVDAIDYDFGLSEEDALTAVERGQYDWMAGLKPLDRLGEIGGQYTAQVHVYPLYGLLFLPMNVNIPPFNNIKARQAVNYALDRRAMTILYGGSGIAAPLCRMVPPGLLPGDGACAWTRGADPDHPAPAWTHPDLTRARQLVHESGTEGQDVTLIVEATAMDTSMGTYLRDMLQAIGYHARLHPLSPAMQLSYSQNTANHVQISLIGWYADYASPSNFLDTVFGCENFHPGSDSSINFSGLCDPVVQALVARIRQAPDTQAAQALWQQVDDRITRLAPAAPMISISYVDLVSPRLGHYFSTSLYHMAFSRVWVR
ncbi:ABC transporter substrate-binding protein [Komagataeibacter medellinensis]|uniref:ABC transporter dipeptide transporter substrate-binding periplasmic protein n=1 Tax=Komagataeibacter medellinensis (strain NBRC 3288 / BCRC 11682 / LMG 1693 / Kondo 51) TaxID=634177 RepID=G2I7F7_KOMMN|nr:ABC transporter substrate-binding protein [Komagataeibacter medellinensis]BAK84054.1 ABC transporter dipeptide transporter substrate-binding periplasmic protein [Komagataeibacter medellinensis NBRC 3288]